MQRKSILGAGGALPILGAAGQKVGQGQKLGASRLELLEVAFGAYAEDAEAGPGGPKINIEDLEKVLTASLSRYLEREIEDLASEWPDDDVELQLHDVKSIVTARQPFINKSWSEVIQGRPKSQQDHSDPDDLFHQLYESHKMLLDSSSGQDGCLEVHALEYILSTCGEEVEHDDFDNLLEKIKHPRKGTFDMTLLIKYLAGLMEEVGIAGSEELAKAACKRVDDIQREKSKQAASQSKVKGAGDGRRASSLMRAGTANLAQAAGEPDAPAAPADAGHGTPAD